VRRRPPVILDWVRSYDLLDIKNRRILTVTWSGRERAVEAICRALHDLTQISGADRVRFVNTRGRSRSFNLRTLVQHLELIQGGAQALSSLHAAIPWLSSILAGWEPSAKRSATTRPLAAFEED
jgi:hypothetical protein